MLELRRFFAILSFIVFGVILIIGCGDSTGGGKYSIWVEFSYPTFWITEDGDIDSSTFEITGEDVTDAKVTVTNVDTEETIELEWNEPYEPRSKLYERGSYYPSENFNHEPGERVSVKIEIGDDTITGGSTITPDEPTFTELSAEGSTPPVTVSWSIDQGENEVSHIMIILSGGGGSIMDIIPSSQTSYEFTSSHITASGTYYMSIRGINMMTLSGAKSGSLCFVTAGYGTSTSFVVD